MPSEDLIFDEQSAWATWVTPDKGMYVDSFDINPGVGFKEHRTTGRNAGLALMELAEKLVTGSLTMAGWQSYLGYWLKAAGLNDIESTQVAASTAYDHGMIFGAAAPAGLSVQAKRSGSSAQNVLGLLLTSLTLSCAKGEHLQLQGDWVAKDEAPSGGNWDYGAGASAPAVVSSPTYFADTIGKFLFQNAEALVGGTPSWDAPSQIMSVSGGTAKAGIEMAEIKWDLNIDARVFWGDRTPYNAVLQNRSVTGRFDLDQSTVDETFYAALRAGTPQVLQFLFTGATIESTYKYELELTLPNCKITSAPLAALDGNHDRRMQSVEFTALLDSNDIDLAVRLRDTQTAY